MNLTLAILLTVGAGLLALLIAAFILFVALVPFDGNEVVDEYDWQ